jgi:hypothetical protein
VNIKDLREVSAEEFMAAIQDFQNAPSEDMEKMIEKFPVVEVITRKMNDSLADGNRNHADIYCGMFYCFAALVDIAESKEG